VFAVGAALADKGALAAAEAAVAAEGSEESLAGLDMTLSP